MLREELIIKYERALEVFKEHEKYLITHDASERSMAHRLAYYLEEEFKDYNVDCEYNVNIEHVEKRKKIVLLEEEAEKYRKNYLEVSVYPDIIVHKRGENKNNKIVIEMKKESTSVNDKYDFLKLRKYTVDTDGDGLRYTLGIFLRVGKSGCKSIYYENGVVIKK